MTPCMESCMANGSGRRYRDVSTCVMDKAVSLDEWTATRAVRVSGWTGVGQGLAWHFKAAVRWSSTVPKRSFDCPVKASVG